MNSKEWKGILFALAGGTMWGFSGTCGQYIFANSNIQADTVTVIRLLGAGILLCLYNYIRQGRKILAIWREPKDVIRLILFATVGLTFCQYSYLKAISYSNSGTATVLQYCGIILIMIVTCFLGLRLPAMREMAALIAVLLGVFFLACHGDPGSLAISRPALLWGGLAALALMLYTMLPGYLLAKWGSVIVTGYAMLIGGILFALATRAWTVRPDWSPRLIAATAAIVLLGTVVAFNFYLKGVELCGPVKTSMIACVEPVVAAVLSAVWLKTAFVPADLAGFALIIAGVLLVSSESM